MTKSEIESLFNNNDEDKLRTIFQNLISKMTVINKESNRLGIMMIIVIFFYYLIEVKLAESVGLGPIRITNLVPLKTFIPLIFAFLILRYKIVSSHKAEIIRIAKMFSRLFFQFEDSNKNKDIFTDDLTRLMMPISMYEEINKLNYKGKSIFGCLGSIIILPVFTSISITPYILQYFWVKELLKTFSSLDLVGKIAVVLTIVVIVISIYYFVQNLMISVKEQ